MLRVKAHNLIIYAKGEKTGNERCNCNMYSQSSEDDVMNGLEKIRNHRKQIHALAARHGAIHLRTFGSAARNMDKPDSDLDILVTMQPGHDLLDMIALEDELDRLLGQKTDVVSDEELSPYMRDRILREAVSI